MTAAQAVVLELPVSRRKAAFPCGCYVDAVPEPGSMMWLRYPNSQSGIARFNEHDARLILERGWVVVDGIRADARLDTFDCPHDVALYFTDQPWPHQHP